jgi:microcystin degradation protein MlrC
MLSFLIKIPDGITAPRKYEDLRDLIIRGIRESVPRSQNLSKVFSVVQQGKDEGSTEFMSHLKDQMRKDAGLDL